MLACVLHTCSDTLFTSMNGKIYYVGGEIVYINRSSSQRNQHSLHTDNDAKPEPGKLVTILGHLHTFFHIGFFQWSSLIQVKMK